MAAGNSRKQATSAKRRSRIGRSSLLAPNAGRKFTDAGCFHKMPAANLRKQAASAKYLSGIHRSWLLSQNAGREFTEAGGFRKMPAANSRTQTASAKSQPEIDRSRQQALFPQLPAANIRDLPFKKDLEAFSRKILNYRCLIPSTAAPPGS